MARTYEPIASQTLGSDTATVEFTSISGNYTDLVCVVSGTTNSADSTRFRFNGDTSSIYSHTSLYGSGSAAGSYRASSLTRHDADYFSGLGTSNPGTIVLSIMSYSNANVFKTTLATAAEAGGGLSRNVCLWRSTAAITSMTFLTAATTFKTGTTFSLFGVKAA